MNRSPVDVAISPDGRWLATANETSSTVSLVDLQSGEVVDELSCGRHPARIQFLPDGEGLLVTASWAGELQRLKLSNGRLSPAGTVHLRYEPRGLTISQDGSTAFVTLFATGEVAEVDLAAMKVVRTMEVGQWPHSLTLSSDGTRLAVGCSGSSHIAVLDVASGDVLYEVPLAYGVNIGHMTPSNDGQYAYFTWMVYRSNPISESNIRRGWILASRIGRIRLDGPTVREAISLDVPGKAMADPYGIDISENGERLVASSSGTHELLVYRLPDLPFQGAGGPGDLIDRELERDRNRFRRVEVGGRPMGLKIADDNRTVYAANYLRNSVQVVDIESSEILQEIDLGSGPDTLARRGMEIFYDARWSLDQWYSCHSCHQDGGGNSRPMDTFNDGTPLTLKTVLPLYHVTRTGPWTWHGWQTDLADSVRNSITTTMIGREPIEKDVDAVVAFLESLEEPPNPFRRADGTLSEAAVRGKKVFESAKAGCAQCHSGEYFTDGGIHDVGLGSESDHYQGYNTPSLRGVYRKVRLLHSGRARSIGQVISDLHRPEDVAGTGPLTEQEQADLIEYLKSL